MKTITLKFTKQEARLMAELLSDLIQKVPDRKDYEADGDGDWYYSVDRCMAGVVALIWHKYYTKLLACETGGTMKITLLEPHALALLIHMAYLNGKFRSQDHELMALSITSHIHKSTT
jgi:hypothetical protein